MSAVEETIKVLNGHPIECTGPGEVTCRGCRHLHWMSRRAYHQHIAEALDAAGLLTTGEEWGNRYTHPDGETVIYRADDGEASARAALNAGEDLVVRNVSEWRVVTA